MLSVNVFIFCLPILGRKPDAFADVSLLKINPQNQFKNLKPKNNIYCERITGKMSFVDKKSVPMKRSMALMNHMF